jgi:hypothetical protein
MSYCRTYFDVYSSTSDSNPQRSWRIRIHDDSTIRVTLDCMPHFVYSFADAARLRRTVFMIFPVDVF